MVSMPVGDHNKVQRLQIDAQFAGVLCKGAILPPCIKQDALAALFNQRQVSPQV